jgi:hypothetical protein
LDQDGVPEETFTFTRSTCPSSMETAIDRLPCSSVENMGQQAKLLF